MYGNLEMKKWRKSWKIIKTIIQKWWIKMKLRTWIILSNQGTLFLFKELKLYFNSIKKGFWTDLI